MAHYQKDVLIRVFATMKKEYCVQEWWLKESVEGRRMVFDTYNEAVEEALYWESDLKAFGLVVGTDQHIKQGSAKQYNQWTSRTIEPKKSQEEIYEGMVGDRSSYGVRIW